MRTPAPASTAPHAPPRGPAGFTVVEALVAVILLGVAGTTLAAAFAASGAIRGRAAATTRASARAADLMALLARRDCAAADTGASSTDGAMDDRWRAVRTADGWAFAESVTVRGAPVPAVVTGVVACVH